LIEGNSYAVKINQPAEEKEKEERKESMGRRRGYREMNISEPVFKSVSRAVPPVMLPFTGLRLSKIST
jgi:hypothetical protein